MPINHDEIIRAQFDGLQLDRQRALNDYEASRLADDHAGVMYSADSLLQIDAKIAALDKIASGYVMAQQAPQGNRYGLSADEVEIANGIAGNDPHMTNDQRQALYAQQRQRLQFLRASGQYRDDQGTVRR